jgi:hypothetical protein
LCGLRSGGVELVLVQALRQCSLAPARLNEVAGRFNSPA